MQLITGGMGFIGSHTARALLDMDQQCLITRHKLSREVSFLKEDIGKGVLIEPVDIMDRSALLDLGKHRRITGIVHLASGTATASPDPFDDAHVALQGLLNVLYAAREWGVRRISIASTIGVYAGVQERMFREDAPLPLTATHVIPTFKKINELLSGYIGGRAGLEVVNLRIGAAWGPLGRAASPFFVLPGLVHSALRGTASAAPAPRIYSDDGGDLCYVKDCGRAIGLLQTAKKLGHGVYNVGSGRVTTNAEVAGAIARVIPEAHFDLAPGFDPSGPRAASALDIARIRADTGFEPLYDVESGIADYITWLRAGNER